MLVAFVAESKTSVDLMDFVGISKVFCIFFTCSDAASAEGFSELDCCLNLSSEIDMKHVECCSRGGP